MQTIVFQLKPVPPFRLDLTVWALRRHPDNLVDRWDGQTYRRVLLLEGQPVEVAVTQTGPVEAPLLRVAVSNAHPHWEWASRVTVVLVKILGLNFDLDPFYRLAAADDRWGPLAARFRGFKPPRFPSTFEALTNAIVCQQSSLPLGMHLLNRLATTYGAGWPAAPEPRPAFPQPGDLAGLGPESYGNLGFSRKKAVTLMELARKCQTDRTCLDNLDKLAGTAARSRILNLPGVGRWSADYVLLRGLGCWSAFPGDDKGACQSFQSWRQQCHPRDRQPGGRHLEWWESCRGLLYFHLFLHRLASEGYLA